MRLRLYRAWRQTTSDQRQQSRKLGLNFRFRRGKEDTAEWAKKVFILMNSGGAVVSTFTAFWTGDGDEKTV
ncbi:hypothetical protein EpCFBP13511_14095 [Erwinia persicina]|uniref:Uncharacterized protein n=1 Tax=Erwinia persicina TaxID=55211 RepID=A0A4U3F697_9GAMM|nr:hypothetical protein EpCFBP13511_14095 [Erwinia persicina]